MGTSAVQRRGILPAMAGIAVATAAAVVIELLLLDDALPLAVSATVLVGLISGVLVTRRLRARNQQPLITVRDLRRR